MRVYVTKIYDLDMEKEVKLCGMLDCDRQQNVKVIKHKMARNRSIFAGLLLRHAFLQEGYTLKQWQQVEIEKEAYGKPYIKGCQEFQYSLSHSGDWALCAVDTKAIGADIQELKTWKIQVAKRFYSKEEYDRILGVQQKDCENKQTKMFYSMWTAKESAVKYSGQSMGAGIRRYVTNEGYSCIYDKENEVLSLHIKLYNELEGYIACLCSKYSSFPEKLEQIDIMEENKDA